jgi:hypothetical protein
MSTSMESMECATAASSAMINQSKRDQPTLLVADILVNGRDADAVGQLSARCSNPRGGPWDLSDAP